MFRISMKQFCEKWLVQSISLRFVLNIWNHAKLDTLFSLTDKILAEIKIIFNTMSDTVVHSE